MSTHPSWLDPAVVHLNLPTASRQLRCSTRSDNDRSSAQFPDGRGMHICLYQMMKVFRWCFELRPDLNDIIFEERRDLSVFKVFLCPDIGRDFRCWIELGWAWMRRKKGSSKNFIPPPLASQFVNQKLRIVRSCPSSASWNGLHFVQRLNSPSWIHFVGYIDDLIAFSSFQLDFEFYRWLIREEKKSTNI